MITKKELKEIRAMLLIVDITFAGIARKFHKSRETVYKAVRNESDTNISKEIRAYIEEKVGQVEVWHI